MKRQRNQYLLVARERLQKLLDGEAVLGQFGLCAFLSWFNDDQSINTDDHGVKDYYFLVNSIIRDLRIRNEYDFYKAIEENQERSGVFGEARKYLAETIIQIIDDCQLRQSKDGVLWEIID